MIHRRLLVLGIIALLRSASAEVKVVVDHNSEGSATPAFRFEHVPSPARNDAAANARFTIVNGERDEAGGGLAKLHDGKSPSEADEPGENFFFNAGTDGGSVLVDLGSENQVQRVSTYSWHPNTRGPQVYRLYAADGHATNFNSQPAKGADPQLSGWKMLCRVDTRPKAGEGGGQYGVSVTDADGMLGRFRYLLFVMSPTEKEDEFGNTFYSEIDVIAGQAPGGREAASAEANREIILADDGRYRITLDTSETPDLTDWAHQAIAPMAKEWYPKIVALLPSPGFEPPHELSIKFIEDMQGVAGTSGTRIQCAAEWFRLNREGEAVGAVFHEMVHVVQDYGRARRDNPNATRSPGWLTEGIPDYLRWFKFEPQTHGAEITARNLKRARYNGGYRITANFLNWASGKYGMDLVPKLNTACRSGQYTESLWKELTGHTVQELGDEWRQVNESRLNGDAAPPLSTATAATVATTGIKPALNTLTSTELEGGWKLLFNGHDFTGWHNFKSDHIRPGWQVKDAALVCVDPHDAGDLCTADQYDSFELQLDYNISEGGNSGIMFHVTDQGGSAWQTGPEFQLEDNAKAADPQRCGWLYALYQPPIDPQTGKPLDATKPPGQWNHVRLLVTPTKCEHEINGVKYFDYVLNSDDFNARVAKSKFGRMPLFAKSETGYITLQGDHGQISFCNIKIRPVK